MPAELADDPHSMSFGSSYRSGLSPLSTSVSLSSSSSSSFSGAIHKAHPTSDPIIDAIRRLNSSSGGGGRGGNVLSMSDLRLVRRLGSGDIGNVYLAKLKCPGAEGLPLAAKVMDKKELEGRSKEGRAKTEREILEAVDHPFLPRLYACAEDDRWSCLLTEFCPGGDLHLLRQRQPSKRFDEAAVGFYASEVVAAMEYLHMMGIIYRDLKPENILVRGDGHIMLTDFDLSLKCDSTSPSAAQVIAHQNPIRSAVEKSMGGGGGEFSVASCIIPGCIVPAVSCFHPPKRRRKVRLNRSRGPCLEFVAEPVDIRSMSFVGTHEYLAPEIVSGEGHGSAVDWWTLGVFVFELLYGVTPFKGPDHELTLANIVARALEFPKEPPISTTTRDLIACLLVKDPGQRLGSTMGAAAIKRHPFFHGVNWALLRCALPPHVPPPSTLSTHSHDAFDDSCPGSPMEYY